MFTALSLTFLSLSLSLCDRLCFNIKSMFSTVSNLICLLIMVLLLLSFFYVHNKIAINESLLLHCRLHIVITENWAVFWNFCQLFQLFIWRNDKKESQWHVCIEFRLIFPSHVRSSIIILKGEKNERFNTEIKSMEINN